MIINPIEAEMPNIFINHSPGETKFILQNLKIIYSENNALDFKYSI
ncbi:MAG: hypothetical protein MGG37_05900 [Trichodesmium sp. MAG_R01]|nr:hypothetical protein [Trichodesmium sp. MAG_R01]